MAIFSPSFKPDEALCIYDNRLIEISLHFFHLEQPILEAIIGFVDTSASTNAWGRLDVEVGSNAKLG